MGRIAECRSGKLVMRLTALLLTAAFLTGCFGDGARDEGDEAPESSASLQAPWWSIGESWTIEFEQAGRPARTTTLVNYANNTFGDLPHFWLGVTDRQEALDHVFFENNPFLGRIHWEILAPHEKGMHSAMYGWPMEDGSTWTSPILFGHEDIFAQATHRADGTFGVEADARADGAQLLYDYDPGVKWFRDLEIKDDSGATQLRARVVEHQDAGARGTYYFLRGRDYLDADGGTTGQSETFEVKEEGATSIAFLLNVQTVGPSSIEFVDPSGAVQHRESLALGGTVDKVVEVKKHPTPGTWTLRYVGSVTGEILVRGVIEYKATL